MEADFRVGQLVSSTTGRDHDKYYLVYKLFPQVVWLVNGAGRTVERPKKKNRKHLKGYDHVALDLALKFEDGGKVDNSEIIKEIKELVAKLEGGKELCNSEGAL